GNPGVTKLGDALASLAESPQAEAAGGVVVVSDGASNSGVDPVEAARRLGLPVHALRTGAVNVPDRAIVDIEAPADAQAGRGVPARCGRRLRAGPRARAPAEAAPLGAARVVCGLAPRAGVGPGRGGVLRRAGGGAGVVVVVGRPCAGPFSPHAPTRGGIR